MELDGIRAEAPRKKFRGRKRYFRHVAQSAERFSIMPAEASWWDLWHYHADWKGWGNLGWRFRREHIRALTVVFHRIAAARDAFRTPFQVFISLSADARQDATYLHTANPNGTPFPYRPTGLRWGVPLPHPDLRHVLPLLPLRVGRGEGLTEEVEPPRREPYFIIYSPKVGVSLETLP